MSIALLTILLSILILGIVLLLSYRYPHNDSPTGVTKAPALSAPEARWISPPRPPPDPDSTRPRLVLIVVMLLMLLRHIFSSYSSPASQPKMNANADEFTPSSRSRAQDAFAANLDRMMFEAETAARDPEMGLPDPTSPSFHDDVPQDDGPSLSVNEDDESHFKDNDGPSGWDTAEQMFKQKLEDMKKEFEAEMAARGKKQVDAANMADLEDMIETRLMERVRDQFDLMEDNIAKIP